MDESWLCGNPFQQMCRPTSCLMFEMTFIDMNQGVLGDGSLRDAIQSKRQKNLLSNTHYAA